MFEQECVAADFRHGGVMFDFIFKKFNTNSTDGCKLFSLCSHFINAKMTLTAQLLYKMDTQSVKPRRGSFCFVFTQFVINLALYYKNL